MIVAGRCVLVILRDVTVMCWCCRFPGLLDAFNVNPYRPVPTDETRPAAGDDEQPSTNVNQSSAVVSARRRSPTLRAPALQTIPEEHADDTAASLPDDDANSNTNNSGDVANSNVNNSGRASSLDNSGRASWLDNSGGASSLDVVNSNVNNSGGASSLDMALVRLQEAGYIALVSSSDRHVARRPVPPRRSVSLVDDDGFETVDLFTA